MVQVTPEASRNEFAGKDADVVYVNVTASREMDEINQKLTTVLADKLRIEEKNVTVASGYSLEKKIVIIMGLPPEEIERRLAD